MTEIKLYTIGFTHKPAERFFELLGTSGAERIIDVRLNNTSQLAGFAKRDDLQYFARALCGMDYVHVPELAPTKEMLDAFKKHGGNWETYRGLFLRLLEERQVELTIPEELIDRGCLLCSEHKPDLCHRLLIAEYFRDRWDGGVDVRHLV